jgi:hypothetical protein
VTTEEVSELDTSPDPASSKSEALKWLSQKVPGFDQLSSEDISAINDFCLLWSFFEKRCLNGNGSTKTIASAANRISKKIEVRAQGFDDALDYFKGRYVLDGSMTSKFDSLHFRINDKKSDVEQVLLGNDTAKKSELQAILIIIYRLRNNLFHGMKWADAFADQLSNFQTANKVLMLAMELLGIDGY